ncbi:MAG: hypothetical protein Q7R79_04925, partial [bacterium]|nr:hypothetical protein [bacterium]
FKKHQCTPKKIRGVVVLSGPGQFSYLRTGIAVANAFGYALNIPIIGISAAQNSTPEDFFKNGLKKLLKAKKRKIIIPEYGSEPNITKGKPLV